MNTSICTSLTLTLTLILLYQVFKTRTVNAIIINTVTVLIAAIVLFIFIPSKEKYENFPNNQLVTFEDFLKKYNISDETELRSILTGEYNEDLTHIYNSNMTLYYSIFSIKSYQFTQKKMWYNISPYFENFIMKDCPTRKQIQYTHLNIGNMKIDYIDRFNGVYVGDTIIYGPPSYQLGFDPNEFTILLLFRFEKLEFSNNNTNIYHIFANTMYNNALDISIINNSIKTDQKGNYTFKLALRFANDNIITSNDIEVNINNVQMMTVVKDNLNLKLSINDMVNNVEVKVFDITLNDTHKMDMLLSNKEMCINETSNCHINIFAFAIFNKAIHDKLYLVKYFSIELYKISAEFKLLSGAFLTSQNLINKAKECPYNPITCSICKDVTDWQQRDLTKFNQECLSAINDECKKNPALPSCECWSKEKEDSLQCTKFKAIFDKSLDLCPKQEPEKNELPVTNVEDIKCKEFAKCMNNLVDENDWKTVDNVNIEYYDKEI